MDAEISDRDVLILLLIAETGINNIHKLMLRFDIADFPGKVSSHLRTLLDLGLIHPTVFYNNNPRQPIVYDATTLGREYLNQHLNEEKVYAHIRSMDNPDHFLELVGLVFKNRTGMSSSE
jgi:hypothetical protein